MRSRLELQNILKDIMGTNPVYFQPPNGMQITYPCIVYALSDIDTAFADNNPYSTEKEYLVTVMDKDADSSFPDKVLQLPKCIFDRFFTSDSLNNYVFRIFF